MLLLERKKEVSRGEESGVVCRLMLLLSVLPSLLMLFGGKVDNLSLDTLGSDDDEDACRRDREKEEMLKQLWEMAKTTTYNYIEAIKQPKWMPREYGATTMMMRTIE